MAKPPAAFADRLLAWARRHGRSDLPWHPQAGQQADPYKVWLSEIMLQQTQLANATAYFQRFLRRFPTLEHLAQAPVDEVLALWSGLGYYARARNLHACAQQLWALGGFPRTAQDWARLPGVGPSTAAAIASVVYGERAAILDGNVRRVLARHGCRPEPWNSPALAKALWPVAQQLLPKASANMPAYTQAIMDLGALVCRPRHPDCPACPVQADCQAHLTQTVDQHPRPAIRRARPVRAARWDLVLHEQALALVQQPPTGLWGGLWTLPARPLTPQEFHQRQDEFDDQLTHDFTHYRLLIGLRRRRIATEQARPRTVQGQQVTWWSLRQALELGLPAPVRRVLAQTPLDE